MTNLIGAEVEDYARWLEVPGAAVHLYGKTGSVPAARWAMSPRSSRGASPTGPALVDILTRFCYTPALGKPHLRMAPDRNSSNGFERGARVQVLVRDNNVDQALKALKKKMQREGIFREMKLRGHYEKPSEKKAREKAEAIRRARKLARKRAQREGLIPMKPKPFPARRRRRRTAVAPGADAIHRLRAVNIGALWLRRPAMTRQRL